MDEHVTRIHSDIGKAICYRRLELGLTQHILAERVEVSGQQIQRYEYGKNKINVDILQRIARALEVPVAYFFNIRVVTEPVHKGEVLSQMEQMMVETFRTIGNDEVRKLMVNLLKTAAEGGRKI